MTQLSWLDTQFCARLSLTLVHFLWQGLAIAMLAGLVASGFRRSSPQIRYAVYSVSLLLMAACPLLTFCLLDVDRTTTAAAGLARLTGGVEQNDPLVLGSNSSTVPTASQAETSTTLRMPVSDWQLDDHSPAGGSTNRLDDRDARWASGDATPQRTTSQQPLQPNHHAPETRFRLTADYFDWQPYASFTAGVYLLGVLVMLSRLLLGLYGGDRLRRGSSPLDDADLMAAIRRRARSLGLSFAPAIARCGHVVVPTVVGVFRPTILLPLSLASGLDPGQFEAILAHELAHIRRYDHLVNLAQRVIEAVLFFHPAVWFVSRRIRVQREQCCDDLVVATGGEPLSYAISLLKVAELGQRSRVLAKLDRVAALGATGEPSSLVNRVRRLIEDGTDDPVRLRHPWVSLLGVATLVALGGVLIFQLNLRAQPADEEGKMVTRSGALFSTEQVLEGEPVVTDEKLEMPLTLWQGGREPARFRLGLELSKDHADAVLAEKSIPEGAIRLTHVDDTAEGQRSIAASGHAVRFERPEDATYVEAVQIFASRYGYPKPPDEDFHVYLLSEKHQVLADLRYPYAIVERGDQSWHTLRTPSVEVPKRFLVALSFNPHRTKGIYLGYDSGVEESHSLAGLPDDGFAPVKETYDWMVRAYLSKQPSGGKGIMRLADWKPPVDIDPFQGCVEAKCDTGQSEGKQSYGGSGPAIRFQLLEVLPKGVPVEKLELKGFRLYASRYGSGYDTEQTLLRVAVLGRDTKMLWHGTFPYALFSYKEKWVDLVLTEPLALMDSDLQDGALTVAMDPEAHQYKGVYFHYNRDPETPHSLAGIVANGFRELPDRQWMIRGYFGVKK